MIVTAAKLAANQANAQHSTGPKTPEGKAKVSKNALRHGFTSKELIVREDEREEFEALQNELLAEVEPEGSVEGLLFEQFLHAAWNLRRLRRLEAELFDGSSDPLTDDDLEQKTNRLARHAARFERSFHRALRELKALQSNRAVNDVWAEATGREFIPLVDVAKVTKQTQKFRLEDLYDDLFDVYVRREKEFLARASALDNQKLAAEEAAATETAA